MLHEYSSSTFASLPWRIRPMAQGVAAANPLPPRNSLCLRINAGWSPCLATIDTGAERAPPKARSLSFGRSAPGRDGCLG
jgi:hypothetical protein